MFSRRFISPFAVLLPTASSNSNFARRKSWLLLGQYNMYANSVKNKSQTGSRRCWKCNSEIRSGVEFFCPSCNIIQRPPKKATYFELMGSPTSFDIDTKRLTQHYKELQWKLHPDKFSDLSKKEQSLSEEQSCLVNEAYHTLLKPLTRGLYLLNLNGIPITEDEATSTDTKFLGLIMDKYEEISSSEKKLKEIKKENSGDLEKSVRKVSRAFEKGTRKSHDENELTNTEFQSIQEQYWKKLLEERRMAAMNRKKFEEMSEKDLRSLIDEFPEFKESDISDLQLQFQTFDLNQDGIIDFEELMQVLDDLRDKSEPAVRQQYFNEIDKDGSGAIDFKEFLALIYQLRNTTTDFLEASELGQIGSLCKRGTDNVQRVRKLSVAKQMLTGLF